MRHSKHILPIIVLAQFCCTSLWFAGNAVMNDLVLNFHLNNSALGHLTSAVQFGFILGSLLFALLSVADRFSPSKVFLISALIGSLFNFATIYEGNEMGSLLTFRFLTGFFLAGIYPVGMKIAADYYDKGLGKSLGFLVGALVLGTAFPHLLKGLTNQVPWKLVLISTSLLAIIGGVLIGFFVPDGPYRKTRQKIDFTSFFTIFKNKDFRTSAFGYFGHMWELYAFWAFVPIVLVTYSSIHPSSKFNVPLISFLVIGIGCIGCILSGFLSIKYGAKRIALIALLLSCICCLISPLIFLINSPYIFIGFLLFWGMVVIADSPLFSTLVASNAPNELKGTGLTIVNAIGFSLTIVSIQLLSNLKDTMDPTHLYTLLAFGPILGLLALKRKRD